MSNLSIRLQQARRVAGLSLRDLADLVDLSHAAIKKYEDGRVYPSSDILLKLSKALKVRIDFFFRPIKVSLDDVKFRKHKNLNRKAIDAIKCEAIGKIERRLELENLYPSSPVSPFKLPSNLPKKIKNFDEIEAVAEKLRSHWKLGLDPIHDLISVLENHGARVFIVDSNEKHFDALYSLIDKQPVIVISSNFPGDRQRFSIAHELAHYILEDRLSSSLDEELACNRFAGAFLFPKESVFQAIGKSRQAIEWPELALLKEQFQLSMGAICHRLVDLQIIQGSYYKKLNTEFRRNGWHLEEPGVQIPSEKKDQAFEKMLFHALGEKYIGESKAAELLSRSLIEFKAIRRVQDTHALAHQ